jgi:hypothetical protein
MERAAAVEFYNELRPAQRRRWAVLTLTGLVCVGTAAIVLSPIAGAVLAPVYFLWEMAWLRRWTRARWIERFPELADPNFRWADEGGDDRVHGGPSPGSDNRT